MIDPGLNEKYLEQKTEIINSAQRFLKLRLTYRWLEQLLTRHHLDPDEGILILCTFVVDRSDNDNFLGCWLSRSQQFFQFDVEADSQTHELLHEYSFDNITDQTHISQHDPEVGKTFAFIALEVLEELMP